ncbi:hypothetical protein B5S28_g1000 [[Candida] boidinii]|nr:hypothetical protein B5S28_g1000 [[Candida] boidinii]
MLDSRQYKIKYHKMSSFEDAISLEEQSGYRDSPEFDIYSDQLSNNLLDIGNNLNNLDKNLNNLEKNLNDYNPLDDDVSITIINNINKFHKISVNLINKLISIFKNSSIINNNLIKIDSNSLNGSQKIVKDKLIKNLSINLKKFNDLQEFFTDLENILNEKDISNFNRRSSSNGNILDINDLENSHKIKQQQQQQQQQRQQQQQFVVEYEPINAEELEYQRNLINERETEIENISNGIQELNEIFHDLSTLVIEQGTTVDNIESNLYSVAHDTRSAHKHLIKADRYQRAKRGLCTWLIIIFAVIVLFLILVIFA